MSTTAHRDEQADEPAKELTEEPERPQGFQRASRAAKLARGVYQHVAAVLGAIGIAALISHFGMDWRGALAEIVGLWDSHIRPPVAFFFHIVVTIPLSLIGVEFEVPLWARDYFSVSIILLLSLLRTPTHEGNKQRSSRFKPLLRQAFESITWPYQIITSVIIVIWTGTRVLASARRIRLADSQIHSNKIAIDKNRELLMKQREELRKFREEMRKKTSSTQTVTLAELDAAIVALDRAIVSLVRSTDRRLELAQNQSDEGHRMFENGITLWRAEFFKLIRIFSPLLYLALLLILNQFL